MEGRYLALTPEQPCEQYKLLQEAQPSTSAWLSENRTGAHIDANILDRYIKKNRNTSTSNELCSREQAAVVVSDSGGGGDLN